MATRFHVRKIKISSYSIQGWRLDHRESFVVYDSQWKAVAKSKNYALFDGKRFMYIKHTAFNNKDFVQAVAAYLNDTVGNDINAPIDGYQAYNAVICRDLGDDKIGCYAEWCDKFSTGFRPTEKFQKV